MKTITVIMVVRIVLIMRKHRLIDSIKFMLSYRRNGRKEVNMKLKEKNALIKMAESLSDKDLEAAYYDAVYDSLGSQADRMVELEYDEVDVRERRDYEKYLGEKADVLESVCATRGIELWQHVK